MKEKNLDATTRDIITPISFLYVTVVKKELFSFREFGN